MKNIQKLLLFAFSTSFVIFCAKPAQAWFRVCNKSSQSVAVAFAYLDVPDSRDYCNAFGQCEPLPRNKRIWNSQGWWQLNSGQCVGVYPHELRKRNSYYYVYARALNSSSSWGGDHSFCAVDDIFSKFGLAYADTRCNGQNTTRRGFQQVYTGNTKNYTYNLVE
jgi:uncharacterized membrane protein